MRPTTFKKIIIDNSVSSTIHHKDEKHPKQDFQVERIAFFSDAVFAIALTLLIIEFKPPVITKNTTSAELWAELGDLSYKLIALIVSFALIISFWMRHHTLFKHIHDYNKPIIIANMAVLLPIIFFPFTTAFLYESVASGNHLLVEPIRFFFINNLLGGAAIYIFYWISIKKYKNCSYPMDEGDKWEFGVELPAMCLSFLLVFILSYISINNSFWGIMPSIAINLYKRFFKKNLSKKNAR